MATDFDDWAERVLPAMDEVDRSRYLDWRRAFHTAAGAGMVKFR